MLIAPKEVPVCITASWNGGMAQSARLDVSATRISADRLRNRVPLVSLHLSYTEMAVVVYSYSCFSPVKALGPRHYHLLWSKSLPDTVAVVMSET